MPIAPASGAAPAHLGRSMRRRRHWTHLLPPVIIVLALLMAAGSIAEAVLDRAETQREEQHNAELAETVGLRTALVEAETSVQSYALGGRPEELAKHMSNIRVLAGRTSALATLDANAAAQAGYIGAGAPVSDAVDELVTIWRTAIRLVGDNERAKAAVVLTSPEAVNLSQRLRDLVDGHLSRNGAVLAGVHSSPTSSRPSCAS